MIPALAGRKKAIGLILGMQGEEKEDKPLDIIAKELIGAVKGNDVAGVASALKAAWSCLESEEYEQAEEG